MINWYEQVYFEQTIYFVNHEDETVGECTLGELAKEYAEKTTSPIGISPVYFTEDNILMKWGYAGSGKSIVCEFEDEEEAEHALLLSFKYDLDNGESPIYYETKAEAEADLKEYLGEE